MAADTRSSRTRGVQIAIDGPGASGKNTVGLLVAHRLRYPFIDTGAMYRALTWRALREGLDFSDAAALQELARRTKLEPLPPRPGAPGGCWLADGEDVTGTLHTPEVDAHVSLLARVPGVRALLLQQQRMLADEGGVVMVGRDIGTAVLPAADLKIFLDASSEERARRRYRELRAAGVPVGMEDVLADLRRRDELDRQRAAAPLRPAADAIILDTDGLAPEEVAERIVDEAGRVAGRRLAG